MRSSLRLIAPLILLPCFALAPSLARAAWTTLGNPICTAAGTQTSGNLVSDGGSGAFVFWTDTRRGATLTDLYATRILADGSIAPGWPVNGAALSQTGKATSPSGAPDGAGGLLVFWLDQTDYKPRMQRLTSAGAVAPGFAADGNILPITVGGPTGYIVRATSDGAGGAYVLWNAINGSADALYVTRVTSSGGFAAGWNATGVFQANSDPFNPFNGFSNIVLVGDPSGGVLVSETHTVDGGIGPNYFVGGSRRTRPDASSAFSVSQYPPDVVGAISIAPDGAEGAFCSWVSGSPAQRRLQHYLSNGTAAWPTSTLAPVGDALFRDGAGGLYLFGRPGADQLELHRRASDASIPAPWTPAGVVVSTTGSYWAYAAALVDDLVFACWSTGFFSGQQDLRAIAVTPDGALAPGWPAGGKSICGLPTAETLTSMMPMPPSDLLIAWTDTRSGNADVYVTLLQPGGPVTLDTPPLGEPPSSLAFAAAPSPNPARGIVELAFLLPGDGSASLELVDVTGRVHARLDLSQGPGRRSATFDVTRLPAGLYWARLQQAQHTVAARFSVVR